MMQIVSPSYNRAGSVKVTEWLPETVIACCQSQASEYRKYYKNLLVVRDEEDGNIARKRNAILNRVDDDIFLVDDDITGIQRLDGSFLTSQETLCFLEKNFLLMHELGAGYWGVNNFHDSFKTRAFHPFSLTKLFFRAVGISKDNLRYDERLKIGEDVDFFLQKFFAYRKVLRLNLYSLTEKTMAGGLSLDWIGRKSLERTGQQIIYKKWGKKIMSYEQREEHYDLPRLHSPIAGL